MKYTHDRSYSTHSLLFVAAGLCSQLMLGSMAHADFEKLSAEDRLLVAQGDEYLVKEGPSVDGSWPQLTAYKKVKVSALEAAAVFADFDLQHTYLPGVQKSQVAGKAVNGEMLVDYSVELSPGIVDNLTFVEHLKKEGDVYKVDWNLKARSQYAERSDGFAHFEPLSAGESVLVYSVTLKPEAPWYLNWLVNLLSSESKPKLQDTVTKLVNRMADVKAHDNPTLEREKTEFLNNLK